MGVAWVGGLFVALSGALGLLVPYSRNSDAAKIVGALTGNLFRSPAR